MRLAALIAILLALGGCASSPAAVSLALNPELTKVVFLADTEGVTCDRISMWLTRKAAQGYEVRNKLMVKNNIFSSSGPHRPLILPLEPGEYHISTMHCAAGNQLYELGEGSRQMGLTSLSYGQSYASFNVHNEKLLNLGTLIFTMKEGQVTHLRVGPLPQITEKKLQELFPDIYGQMTYVPYSIPQANLTGDIANVEKRFDPQTVRITVPAVRGR